MKKRNLLLVILAVLLVFGMIVGCGKADDPIPFFPEPEPEQPEEGGDDYDGIVEEEHLGVYECSYIYGWYAGKDFVTVTETIKFGKNTFDIEDNCFTAGIPSATKNSTLHFSITDWEDFTVPTTPATAVPPSGYTSGRFFKGKIISQEGYVPSKYTAPDSEFTAADVKDDGTGPDCYMYLYFKNDGTFVRTTFTKVATKVTDIVNGYSKTTDSFSIPREYTLKTN